MINEILIFPFHVIDWHLSNASSFPPKGIALSDILSFFVKSSRLSYTDQFPRPGETIKGVFTTSPGGKGANQAAQAAMLGAAVCMIGKVSG